MSKKSVNFVCEPTEGTSPENNLSKVDVSVPKNNRQSLGVRFSTGASKRFSTSTCNSTEAAAYFTKILDDEIERIEGKLSHNLYKQSVSGIGANIIHSER